MPRIKEKKEEVEEIPKIEDLFISLVKDLDDLRNFIAVKKLNPLEKIMATELLLHNYSFIPQYKIELPEGWNVNSRKYFVVDFFLPDFGIIIETDGKIHLTEENQIKDRNKDNILICLGYRIFRFDWDEVMKKNEDWDIFYLIENLVNRLRNENPL